MQRPWDQGGFVSYPESIEGEKIRVRSETFADHFSQAGLFWRSQAAWEQDHIVSAFCFELAKVEVPAIRERMVSTLTQVDEVLAQRVADGLGMAVPPPPAGAEDVPYTDEPESDPALSMANTRKDSVVGRKVALLIADQVDGVDVEAMSKALLTAGASVKLIAPRVGSVKSMDGSSIKVDHSFATVGSVLFDAVFIPGGPSAKTLCGEANAVLFVKEAYKHGKAVGASNDGVLLISQAARSAGAPQGAFQGPGIFIAAEKSLNPAYIKTFIEGIAHHRFTERPDLNLIVA